MNNQKAQPQVAQYLGNAVYGALDGTVTTFAIIAGSIGASLPTEIIVILALANLFADGFSMSVGSYLSERSKLDYTNKMIADKKMLLKESPDLAKAEVRGKYKRKGFEGSDLDRAVNIVTQDKSRFLKEILSYEGISSSVIRPFTISLITFLSFVTVGTIPILPMVLVPGIGFIQILFFVALVLFAIGSFRSRVSHLSWWRGGIEIALAGVIASLIAFIIGDALTKAFGS
jgi:vacuolar iron transporter family protein